MRRWLGISSLTAAAGAVLLVGCAGSSPSVAPGATATPTATSARSPSPTALRGTVTVLAAASLTDVLATVARDLERAEPGVKVALSFGASSTLVRQVAEGAPADVLITADEASMARAVDAKTVGAPIRIASNVLEIAVPKGNPARIRSVSDLARQGVSVAVCQAQVPCGSAAAKLFAKAKVTVRPVTQEADVRAVLTKVRLGEVDAGVVYATDVSAAAGAVEGVALPEALRVGVRTSAAILASPTDRALAEDFLARLTAAPARAAFTAAGFGPA